MVDKGARPIATLAPAAPTSTSLTSAPSAVAPARDGAERMAHRARRRQRVLRLIVGGTAAAAIVAIIAGSVGNARAYSVSVPVTLRPHDPALWGLVEAGSFAEARALDPSLPDPASLESLGAAGLAPAAGMSIELAKAQSYIGPPARPYVFKGATATDTARAHYCLTAALYYEGASESDDGLRGIAQVVLNRVRHPSFPASVCGVVFQGSERARVCQFTFACDGAMARRPSREQWSRASRIAAEALAGRVYSGVGLATHYHTQAVWPRWGKALVMTNVVGAHIFHRWRGRFGEPGAFLRAYSGREPAPGPYLPIAQQLGAVVAAPTTPVPAAPGLTTTPPIGPVLKGDAALPQASAPVASVPVAPPRPAGQASAPAAAEPPVYADPRLSGSGSIREEYRNSGTARVPAAAPRDPR